MTQPTCHDSAPLCPGRTQQQGVGRSGRQCSDALDLQAGSQAPGPDLGNGLYTTDTGRAVNGSVQHRHAGWVLARVSAVPPPLQLPGSGLEKALEDGKGLGAPSTQMGEQMKLLVLACFSSGLRSSLGSKTQNVETLILFTHLK